MSPSPQRRLSLVALVSAAPVAIVAVLLLALVLVSDEILSTRAANSSSPFDMEQLDNSGESKQRREQKDGHFGSHEHEHEDEDDHEHEHEDEAGEISSYASGGLKRPNRGDRDRKRQASIFSGNKRFFIESLADSIKTSKFVKDYLVRSVVFDRITSDENFLILVPSDQAMDKMSKIEKEMFTNHQDKTLAFHIVRSDLEELYSSMKSFEPDRILFTIDDQEIHFSWRLVDKILLVFGAKVEDAIQKENIALVKIDQVLYQPQDDFWAAMKKAPNLSKFTGLIRNFRHHGWLKSINNDKLLTLFAPTDAAFKQLDARDREFIEKDGDLFLRRMKRHLCKPMTFLSSVYWTNSSTWDAPVLPRLTIKNLLNEEIVIHGLEVDKPYTQMRFGVGGAEMPHECEMTTQGVMHIIDGLL